MAFIAIFLLTLDLFSNIFIIYYMNNILVVNKKNNSKLIEEFSKTFLIALNEPDKFANDEFEIHKKLLYWLTRYTAKCYNINTIQINFDESKAINNAECCDNIIYLSTEMLTCDNLEEFLFQSILNIFHESNHIYINEIEENFRKGLDGKANIKLHQNGSGSLIEYFETQNYSKEDIELFADLLYFTSPNEICAFNGSCRLGLSFLNEVKEYFINNNISTELLEKLEIRLKKTFEKYKTRIEEAKNNSKSILATARLKVAIYKLQEEAIYEILSNRISPQKYDAFLAAIRAGYFDETQIENYKNAILINQMGIDKTKLFCNLINIDTYKITKKDLKIAISLIESEESLRFENKRTKLNTINLILHNIEENVINSVYKEMHTKDLEK